MHRSSLQITSFEFYDFCYDFDILIADFGRDLTRIQARLIFEFGLYAAGRRDFSASIRDRLVFATGFYTRHYGMMLVMVHELVWKYFPTKVAPVYRHLLIILLVTNVKYGVNAHPLYTQLQGESMG